MQKEKSDRRGFLHKLLGLTALTGIAGLLAEHQTERSIIPMVQAGDGDSLVIGQINTGSSTTTLNSSMEEGYGFKVSATDTGGSGAASGITGVTDSNATGAIGVDGWALATSGSTTGVFGHSDSFKGTGVDGFASSATGGTGVAGHSDGTNGMGIFGFVGATSAIPIVGRGATGQTANLQEWQKSDMTPLTVVDKDGKLGIGTSDPGPMLHIVSGTTGPLNAASAPPGSAPNSFIAENLTPGNFKSQFTFRASGANKWSFGNDESGTGGQDFFIWDEVAAATRLSIDSSGVVHGTFQTTDLIMANGARVTEEGEGFAFKNKAGMKIAVLDSEGNLQVKGKITENPNL